MINLINLKSWVNTYFYTTEEDKTLFHNYINKMCYKNGVLEICMD